PRSLPTRRSSERGRQAGAAVDADDEVVLRLARADRFVEHAAQLDAGQPLVLAEQVGQAGGAGEQPHRREAAGDERQPLAPAPAPPPVPTIPRSPHGPIVTSGRGRLAPPAPPSERGGERVLRVLVRPD